MIFCFVSLVCIQQRWWIWWNMWTRKTRLRRTFASHGFQREKLSLFTTLRNSRMKSFRNFSKLRSFAPLQGSVSLKSYLDRAIYSPTVSNETLFCFEFWLQSTVGAFVSWIAASVLTSQSYSEMSTFNGTMRISWSTWDLLRQLQFARENPTSSGTCSRLKSGQWCRWMVQATWPCRIWSWTIWWRLLTTSNRTYTIPLRMHWLHNTV